VIWTQAEPFGIFLKGTGDSPIMRKSVGVFVLFALMWGPTVLTEPAGRASHLSEAIQYLLDFVETSEAWLLQALEAYRQK
jgi:hypothetical protein